MNSWIVNPRKMFSLGLALLLFVPSRGVAEDHSVPDFEMKAVNKIARLTAREHSAILFAVWDQWIGYAKDGDVQWIDPHHSDHINCQYSHAALSHDGLHVAFVTGGDGGRMGHCSVVIYDLATRTRRELIQTEGDPGEISWSWDDSKIALLNPRPSIVSVQDGVSGPVLSYPPPRDGEYFGFWVWSPMQWLHDGKNLVVEFEIDVPGKKPGTARGESDLILVSDKETREIGIGRGPAVSPASDLIAYYAPDGLSVIHPDGRGKAILSRLDGKWPIAWSHDGGRLFFGTIVSEDRRDNLYLLDVESGRCETFLKRTSITVRGWH